VPFLLVSSRADDLEVLVAGGCCFVIGCGYECGVFVKDVSARRLLQFS